MKIVLDTKGPKLISVYKTPLIEFLCDERYIGVAPPPFPAGQGMPEWFRKIPAFSKTTRDVQNRKAMNAKKCLPMIDAMTVGFIIPLAIDQHLTSNGDCTEISVSPTSREFDPVIEFHSPEQVGGTSKLFPTSPIKFINPWVIRTPPGWSTLFTPCINHLETRFICLSGMVDTDKYPKQVNFPGTWTQPNFDDTLPAGTPLVTVIPMRRADVVTKYDVRQLTNDELKEIERIRRCQNTRSHYYTDELRDKDRT